MRGMTKPDDSAAILAEVEAVLNERRTSRDPGSYTAKMLQGDPLAIRRKVLEEAFEVCLASEKTDLKNLAEEVADLWFHSLLLLVRHGLGAEDVYAELRSRQGKRRAPKP